MKPQAPIGNKKRRHEADGAKILAPARSTRSTGSPSTKRGRLRNECGGPSSTDLSAQGRPFMVNAGSEPPSLCPKPSSRKKRLEDEGGLPVCQPHRPRHVPSRGEMLPDGEGSPTRKCLTCIGSAGHSTWAKDLAVELQSSPLSRPARFRKCLQDVSNRASLKRSDSGNLFDLVAQIIFDRGIKFNDKFNMICSRIGQFNAFQEEKGHAEIVELANEAQVEIANLDQQCQSLHAATSVLQQKLHDARSLLQTENAVFQKTVDDLQSKLVCRELKIVELEAATKKSAGHEVERGIPKSLNQMTPIELVSKILSLNEITRVLTVELEKRSQTLDFSVKLHPAEANGHEKQSSLLLYEAGVKCQPGEEAHEEQELDPLCVSYSDASATPNLLDKAICYAKEELTRFQNEFVKAFTSKSPQFDKYRGLLNPDMFLARKNHLCFYVKSVGNEIFFEGFENESFDALFGVSRFPHPNLRQTIFYDYYKANIDSITIEDDSQFEEFCKAKVSSFGKMFQLDDDGKGLKFRSFEELCGPKLGAKLALSFRAAATRVWLLHKLAFSFEPPASIFRVVRGADIDLNDVETVVKLAGNARSVSKVGFMITPGLRLGNNVMMRSEVYPSAAQTCTVALRSRQTPARK